MNDRRQEHENVHAWIDRQPWPDDIKVKAHRFHDNRREQGLHPLTGSAWKSWARAWGIDS